jgi:flagellar export protein FliJ
MKPFRFRLQAVLILREKEEATALENYAEAHRQQMRATGLLSEARESLLSAQLLRNKQVEGGCRIWDMNQHDGFVKGLGQRVREEELALARAKAKAERAFEQVLNSRQKREVITKCRDRDHAKHQLEQRAYEQKAQDELAARTCMESMRTEQFTT